MYIFSGLDMVSRGGGGGGANNFLSHPHAQ